MGLKEIVYLLDINAMHALPTQSASVSKSGSKGAAAPAEKKVSQNNDGGVEGQLPLPEPEVKKL